ncbi:MAG: ABC transporter permease [Thermoguttaceae bacterium]
MSLWRIAWRSIQQRSLASALTAFSMALGVALVVAVLVIYGVIEQSFRRGAQGYDLIIGAKGSPLELVLSTVYHLGRPMETIPYSVYDVLTTSTKFDPYVDVAVPLCLGDNYKGFRVIGTNTDMFDRLQWHDGRNWRDYEYQEGGNFAADAPFEAVVGAVAARKAGLKVGGEPFRPVHGSLGEQGRQHGEFTVVGVLKPTGTPIDRAIFVNMEGFYRMHAEPEEGQQGSPALAAKPTSNPTSSSPPNDAAKPAQSSAGHDHEFVPYEKRKLTALLVVLSASDAIRKAMPKIISQDPELLGVQAVNPTEQISRLLEGIVGNLQLILLILAVLIVIVAGIGVMVSIYNSMSDRRHEIAIIRALGAKRRTIMAIVLLESILLALGGGGIGLLLGHGLTGALAPMIAEHTGVVVSPLQFQLNELILVPGLILLASAVGYMPAVVAYRTDVAQSLIASP